MGWYSCIDALFSFLYLIKTFLSNVFSKSQQIVVRIKQGKFILAQCFGLQFSIWVDAGFVVKQGLINTVDIVRTDIDLPIIFFGLKILELKKMNFNLVFSGD